MQIGNIDRLWENARARRQAANLYSEPGVVFYNEPCVQCGSTFRIQTRHTDMVTGTTTYWCDQDYDHWWNAITYLPQLRAGEIESVRDLFVIRDPDPNFDDQLTGWPI